MSVGLVLATVSAASALSIEADESADAVIISPRPFDSSTAFFFGTQLRNLPAPDVNTGNLVPGLIPMTSRTGKLVIDFLEANGNGLVSDRLVVSFDTTGQPVNTAKVIIDAFSDENNEAFPNVQIGVDGVTKLASFPEVLGPFDPPERTFAQIDVTSQIFRSGQADFRLEFVSDLEPIPEPATLILFGTTMAGLWLAARWRRRRQN
jgi:hypothetical protein